MTKELAQKKFADWAGISENILMFVTEVKDAFHFMYEKNNMYFKIAIAKTDEAFYSINNTLNMKEINLYDKTILKKESNGKRSKKNKGWS